MDCGWVTTYAWLEVGGVPYPKHSSEYVCSSGGGLHPGDDGYVPPPSGGDGDGGSQGSAPVAPPTGTDCGPDYTPDSNGGCVLSPGAACEANGNVYYNGVCMSEADAWEEWEEDVTTAHSFDSNPCLTSVWNKLKTTNAAASLLNKFENSTWIDLHLEAQLSTNANAGTNVSGSKITINFNPSKLDRSQLSIARTFLHEMVHAELYRKVASVDGQISIGDFPGIYDYIRRFVNNWQHQQMAAHYINTIANGLSLFDNASRPMQFYQDIAWIGLWEVPDYTTDDPDDTIETEAWKGLSITEQIRVINIIANFQSTEDKNCQ